MAGQPGLAMVIVYARVPAQPFASVAVIEKVNVPAVVGVPVIALVAALRIRPPGSAPLDTENAYGAVPPDAETVWLYGVPTVPFGSVAGFTVRSGQTITPQVLTLLVSSVTAPVRASSLAGVFAPVFIVIAVRARRPPTKKAPVPTVAELPTCQN